MFYRYVTLDFKFFHSFFIFTKKQKMKYSTCFSFLIFKRKMKNEIQLTPVILFFNTCFKRLGALHEQALPQPSLDCSLHKGDGGSCRSAVSEINIFKLFFLPVTPYFFYSWFFCRSLIDCIMQKTAHRITNTSTKVFF